MNLDHTIAAVVTGGASGLGAAAARALAAIECGCSKGEDVRLDDANRMGPCRGDDR